MTSPTYKSMSRQLLRYKVASVNLSWVGSYHPDERDAVRAEYIRAEASLRKTMRKLFKEEKQE